MGSSLNIAFLHGHINVVQALLKRDNIDVNTTDYHGNTALHQAIAHKCTFDIIQKIIARDADLSLKNGSGLTPLQLAEKTGNQEIIDYLTHLQNR